MTLRDSWEMIRTPMAAPETKRLKAMRLMWLMLCVALGFRTYFIGLFVALLGPKASLIPLILLLSVVGLGYFYFTRKRHADDAWLDQESSK